MAAGAIHAGPVVAGKADQKLGRRDWSKIRGFNYQPSYGSSGFELWQKFDAQVIETEVSRGKRYFPKINTLRCWQSWDSFIRNPRRYSEHFETTLRIADKFGLAVMPVLFNRWHTSSIDYGGIYIDHFLPGASGMQKAKMFDAFLEAIVGRHQDDPRILVWDRCNKPFFYGPQFPQKAIVMEVHCHRRNGLSAMSVPRNREDSDSDYSAVTAFYGFIDISQRIGITAQKH
jgi:hypothetical protein